MAVLTDDLLVIERSGTLYKAQASEVVALGGGGGGATMGLHDFWSEVRLSTTDVSQGPFIGSAIASGANNAAVPDATIVGYNPYGILMRSSTTANSGYRYFTSSLAVDYFGVTSRKFRAQFLHRGDAACDVRVGFFDNTAVAGAVTDGVMLIVQGSGAHRFYAYSNGSQTNGALTTSTFNQVITCEIDINDIGTSARCRLWLGDSNTPVIDNTMSTGIPVGSARKFGAGIVAAYGGTPPANTEICVLYSMGIGTIGGYQKITGRT